MSHNCLQSVPRVPPLARLVATALTLGIAALDPAAVQAQTANGAIGVSLTVVQAVSSVSTRFSTPIRGAGGALVLNGSAPVTGPTSQVLMVAVLDDGHSASSAMHLSLHTPAGDRTLTPGVAVPSTPTGLIPSNAGRDPFPISYRIRTGAGPDSASPVAVRIAYLAVPGT